MVLAYIGACAQRQLEGPWIHGTEFPLPEMPGQLHGRTVQSFTDRSTEKALGALFQKLVPDLQIVARQWRNVWIPLECPSVPCKEISYGPIPYIGSRSLFHGRKRSCLDGKVVGATK